MTSFCLIFIQLLAIAIVATGFSASTGYVQNDLHRATTRHVTRLQTSPDDGQDVAAVHTASSQLHQSIRPVFLSTVVASSIFASLPMMAHADTADDYSSNNHAITIHTQSSSAVAPSTLSNAVTSSMQLSSSTLATPIGEMQYGSDSGIGKSFGQWFFVIYVVVSLLAGGKEMLKRAQNQMDKDSE